MPSVKPDGLFGYLSTALLVALSFAEPAWTLDLACALMVAAAVIATRSAR